VRADGMGDLRLQHRELRVDVPAARQQRAVVALAARERAEDVVLQLGPLAWLLLVGCEAIV